MRTNHRVASCYLDFRCLFRWIAPAMLALFLVACGGGGGDTGGGAGGGTTVPSALSYTSPQTYVVGTVISPLNPTVMGTVTSYSIAPGLPAGLTLNTTSGQISGTPTTATSVSSYVVTAQNSGGSTTFSLSITVNNPVVPAPSALSYPSPQTFTVGVVITALNPTVTGAVVGYSVAPTLPAGLALNATTGQISGTPTTASAAASYVITAQNSGGSTTFSLSIAIVTASTPGAASVTVSYGIKQVILNWTAVSGATFYRVLKNADGSSGYAQIGSDQSATGYTDIVAVHLTDWINARYMVLSCNANGCTNSAAIFAINAQQSTGYFKASNTDSGDQLGYVVVLSADGNTLAAGAPSEGSAATGIDGNQADNNAAQSGAVYVYTRSGNTWSQQAYIKASNTDAYDNFGYALALSADGNTLAVGAYSEGSGATGINGNQADNSVAVSGAAYVYTRSGTAWSQQAYIKASNTNTQDSFGLALALSGDGNTLAVGAPIESSVATGINGNQADNSSYGSGAVYVFTRSGIAWSQQAYIKASNTLASPHDHTWHALFGKSVALNLDGTTLAIGSPDEFSNATGINGDEKNILAPGAGAVYVFVRSGSTWAQQAYVKASNSNESDLFGSSLALSADGNTMAVGAFQEASATTGINGNQADNSRMTAGAAYAFTRSGTNWSQQAYIKASNTGASDRFGFALALSADGATLAVGAWGESSVATGINGDQNDNSVLNSGAVYTYRRVGTVWAQASYVKSTNTFDYETFGYGVALSGDGSTLAVGAPGEKSAAVGVNGNQNDHSLVSAGAVFVY